MPLVDLSGRGHKNSVTSLHPTSFMIFLDHCYEFSLLLKPSGVVWRKTRMGGQHSKKCMCCLQNMTIREVWLPDRHTDAQTDAKQSDPYVHDVLLRFAGDTKIVKGGAPLWLTLLPLDPCSRQKKPTTTKRPWVLHAKHVLSNNSSNGSGEKVKTMSNGS